MVNDGKRDDQGKLGARRNLDESFLREEPFPSAV
jgi:hypothetical protein